MNPVWIPVIAAIVTGALSGVAGIYTGAYKTRAELSVAKKSHEHQLIEALQDELKRYRERTDRRLDELEELVTSYRAFIGIQRDHMADHKIPLPPWPPDLPR